jgi:hypothetical protein
MLGERHVATLVVFSEFFAIVLMGPPFAHSRIPHAVVVISTLVVVSPVGRKWDIFPSAAEDGKSEEEIDDTGSSVHTRTEDIIVLDEPVRSISS